MVSSLLFQSFDNKPIKDNIMIIEYNDIFSIPTDNGNVYSYSQRYNNKALKSP